jgi:hypothetical protein
LAACNEDRQPGGEMDKATTLEDYATMDRTTFVQAVEAQLATINRDLTEVQQRIAEAGSTAKQEVKAAVESLPEKRDAVQQKLTAIKDSVATASEDVRKDLVESCRQLKDALKKALADLGVAG